MVQRNVLNKKAARFLSLILALLMVFTVCGTYALAESAEDGQTTEGAQSDSVAVPSPSASFYVYDEEEIISEETKAAILSRNGTLYEKYGIQIVIMTVKSIPGEDINAKGAYLHRVIDSWQIGGASEKALVLMLSSTERDYVAVSGDGLSAEFTVEAWSKLFTESLEPKFGAGEYDAGVLEFFNAIADKAEKYAFTNGITAADPTAAPSAEPSAEPEKNVAEETEGSVFVTILKGIGLIIFIIIVLLIVGFIVIYVHGQMVRKKRREARRRKAMQARAQQNTNSPAQNKTDDSYRDFMNRY